MKALGVLIVILSGCSTFNGEQGKLLTRSNSALSSESFMKWDEKRLAAFSGADPLIKRCHAGDIANTLRKYVDSYAKKETNPYYWLHIGNCYLLGSNRPKAEFYLQMAHDEAKEKYIKAAAMNNLALIHVQNRKWERAIASFKKASDLDSNVRVPLFNLSKIYVQFGLFDKTIDILSGSDFRAVQDVDVDHTLALAYLYKGDLQAAEAVFQRIPSKYHSRDDISISLALLQYRKGELKKAEETMKDREPANLESTKYAAKKLEQLIKRRTGK